MSDVYAARRGLLRDRCAAAGNAAALITRPANVRYLSGASPLGAVLLVGPTEDAMFCAGAPTGEADEGRLDEHLRVTVLACRGGEPA
ncbi:aminopeptidase P family N-terminal domain-containing protein, partial [Streptomyces sp. NPDC054987]